MMRCTDKYELHKLFPLKCTMSFQTNGIQDGMVIRFKTFYFKIYDHRSEYAYIVKGYRYTHMNPVFIETIPVSKFMEFASMFNREDYLSRYHNHCCYQDFHHRGCHIK